MFGKSGIIEFWKELERSSNNPDSIDQLKANQQYQQQQHHQTRPENFERADQKLKNHYSLNLSNSTLNNIENISSNSAKNQIHPNSTNVKLNREDLSNSNLSLDSVNKKAWTKSSSSSEKLHNNMKGSSQAKISENMIENEITRAYNKVCPTNEVQTRHPPSEQEMMLYIFHEMDTDRDDILVREDVINYFEKNDLSSDDVIMFWKCFDRKQTGQISKNTYCQLLGIAPKDNEAVAVWRRLFFTSRTKQIKGMTVNQIKRIFAQTARDRPIDIVELWLQSRRDETGLREVSVEEITNLLRDWCGVNEEHNNF